MNKGIDVSSHQKVIDWAKVKAAGIKFAIIRAAYGTNTDSYFKRNIEECNRLDIPCGVYAFSYALNESQARAEANHVLELVKHYRLEYPVCFDYEYDSVRWARDNGITITNANATAFADVFLSEIEKAGYYAMNYSNKDYLRNYFDMTVLGKYDLWYAWWNTTDKPDRGCGIWQYASNGSVSGITGRVDMNIAYKDYPAIIRRAGLNRLTEQPENIEELKKELEYYKAKAMSLESEKRRLLEDINSLAAPVAAINITLQKYAG